MKSPILKNTAKNENNFALNSPSIQSMTSIIVPAYDEEEVIADFIHDLEKKVHLRPVWELVIVNDGSKDRTAEIITRLAKKYQNIRLVNHDVNKGLGAAIATGISSAHGEIIVEMDADMTHPPELIPKLVKAVQGGADAAFASRYVPGGGMQNVPDWRVALSVAANKSFALFLGLPVKDTTAGFRAYRASLVKQFRVERPGFAVQLELTTKLAKHRAKIVEIPYMLVNRKQGSSKFRFFKMVPKYFVNLLGLFWYRWMGKSQAIR